MKIKIGKFEADVPLFGVVVAAIIADNMYANHCKKNLAKVILKEEAKQSPEEES